METKIHWQRGPETRGTFDILWSAFITLGLCVWSAVHPNIQIDGGALHDLRVRLFIMLVAIVFPEVVLSAAWQQRIEVHRLTKSQHLSMRMNNDSHSTRYQPINTNALRNEQSWTETQAFFVAMGGFAVHRVDKITNENVTTRCVFTTDGIELMEQSGLAPRLDKSDVDDRSNADIIAKTIVIIQVLWFATQLIARVTEGLAISALEIHTVLHVGCAILMYVIWWNKPYAVGRSIVISDRTSTEIAALFLFSALLHETYERVLADHIREKTEYWEKRAVSADPDLFSVRSPPRMPRRLPVPQALEMYRCQSSLNRGGLDHKEMLLQAIVDDASEGLERLQKGNANVASVLDQPRWRGIRQNADNFTIRQIWGSWTMDVGHEMSSAKLTYFVFNLIYGAGHLAAWRSDIFPTDIERWIWRASALHVGGLLIYGSIWILYWMAVRSESPWLLSFRNGDANIVMGPFFCLMAVAYVFARCYFFVEALLSLRLLPTSAYQTVRWTNYIPHSS